MNQDPVSRTRDLHGVIGGDAWCDGGEEEKNAA